MSTSWARPGVHVRPDGGVDVGVYSVTDVALVVGDREVALTERQGELLFGTVPGVPEGSVYALRSEGRLLLDPWAVEVTGELPWAVVRASLPEVPALGAAWRDQVVYELQVRAFTAACPMVPPRDRGTLRGLASGWVVEHLAGLGVTAVELMPLSAWETEPRLARLGLRNQWGYNPATWMAVEPALGTPEDMARCVEVLHDAGIAVIQDVVFNHTSEGPDEDPVVRHWRKLQPDVYLRDDAGVLDNRTGCGHTVDLTHPVARRAALDSLRHWACAYGVDGFRFDLAAVAEPLVPYIEQDPVLSQRWMIAEPWDAAGGRGHFPPPWASWSDSFRDAARGYWLSGAVDGRRQMGGALTGSVDTVAFAVCHDGFTLADVTSYVAKHNLDNGEHDRDGSSNNSSANAGVEGPTDIAEVLEVRRDWQRALLATVLLSPSVPMLSMGDELGFSQQGNNNGYCLPFEVDWSLGVHDQWIRTLTSVRRSLALARPSAAGPGEARWWRVDGTPMTPEDWGSFGPLLLELDGRLLFGLNPLPEAVPFGPVDPGWELRVASGQVMGPRSVTLWSR